MKQNDDFKLSKKGKIVAAVMGAAALLFFLGKGGKSISAKVDSNKEPDKPSEGTEIKDKSKLKIEEIKNSKSLTMYFKTVPENRDSIVLFAFELYAPKLKKYSIIDLYEVIGAMKEVKSRKKLIEVIKNYTKKFKEVNSDLIIHYIFVTGNKDLSGTVDTFNTIKHKEFNINTSYNSIEYYDLNETIKNRYFKLENKHE